MNEVVKYSIEAVSIGIMRSRLSSRWYELMKFLILKKGSSKRGIRTLFTRTTSRRTLLAAGGRYFRNVGADIRIASPYKGMNNGWKMNESILASRSVKVILSSLFIRGME
jgi:hypothetical protein